MEQMQQERNAQESEEGEDKTSEDEITASSGGSESVGGAGAVGGIGEATRPPGEWCKPGEGELLCVPLLSPLLHGVGCPLYAGLKTCAQLEAPSGHIHLIPHHPHDKFGDGKVERIPYPYRAHPQALIQCNNAAFHQSTVRGPGG